MTGIYLITNMVNGKRYVGQSVNIRRRMWDHNRPHGKSLIARAIRKYGKTNFKHEVLEECPVSLLDAREIYWIKQLSPEYNIACGAIRDGFDHCMPEHVRKVISRKAKEQWGALSAEEKRRVIEERLIGPHKGHPVSPETRDKLRAANLGKKWGDAQRSKFLSTFAKKRELGCVRDGSSHFKRVVCQDTGIVYESVKAAAAAIGALPSTVTSVLKGRQHRTRGLRFAYYGVETIRDECNEVGPR
jgi:group I intron endonuclease